MDWSLYEKKFLFEAKLHGKRKDYCDKYLAYAKNLYDNNLPIVYNVKHFGKLVGYKMEYLYGVANSPKSYYRVYSIPKKNGGLREICEPLPSLKEIQTWILENILYQCDVSVYAKAFVRGKSLKDNARFHRKQKVLMTLDIHDYFGSISSARVLHLFKSLGYTESVSVLLTSLCTFKGCLPQGAPTSPALSNIITRKMDEDIAIYTRKNKIRYTRYADDMSFSGDFSEGNVYSKIKHIVNSYGFKLNEKKTRVRKHGQQQEVTGIIVNEKIQIPKKKRSLIRQEIYYIKKFGLNSHLSRVGLDYDKTYIKKLLGKVEFGLFINPNDMELLESKKYLLSLE